MIELFAINISKYLDQEIPTEFLDKVTAARRKRVLGFRHSAGAWSSLIGELLVLKLYQQFTGSSASSVSFGKNQYGRPYIVDAPDFSYNVSHSGDWVVCVVCPQAVEVGVDVEKVRTIRVIKEMAVRFFSVDEVAHLLSVPAEKQNAAFVTIWTRKESYLKACGTGVNRSLAGFTVPCEDKTLQKQTSDSLPCFTFFSWSLAGNYRLTACCDLADFSPEITIVSIDEF